MSDLTSKKNCIFLTHIFTGDNLVMYAAVRNFQKIYENVYIYCLFRNRLLVTQLYKNYNNIHIIILNEDYTWFLPPENSVNELKNSIVDYDLILTGHNDISKFNSDSDCVNYFWRVFYKQINLPYEIVYDYMDINRNNKDEENLYRKLIEKYGEKYIFVHDHRNVKYQHHNIRKNIDLDTNMDIPIFHPNFNYYSNYPDHKYYHLWDESLFLSDNLLDYCLILENAQEIHINDSCFSCLCPYLNLNKVTKKSITTNITHIVDYHYSYEDWNVIRY